MQLICVVSRQFLHVRTDMIVLRYFLASKLSDSTESIRIRDSETVRCTWWYLGDCIWKLIFRCSRQDLFLDFRRWLLVKWSEGKNALLNRFFGADWWSTMLLILFPMEMYCFHSQCVQCVLRNEMTVIIAYYKGDCDKRFSNALLSGSRDNGMDLFEMRRPKCGYDVGFCVTKKIANACQCSL